jgi:hypothetical protein
MLLFLLEVIDSIPSLYNSFNKNKWKSIKNSLSCWSKPQDQLIMCYLKKYEKNIFLDIKQDSIELINNQLDH